jgi:two-component system sensor histidine kinase TctE
LLAAVLVPSIGDAQVVTYPAPGVERERLRISGATDRQAMEPPILDFQSLRPDVAVEYHEFGTVDLHEAAVRGRADLAPDLLISSAADLQVKLVNDGLSRPHVSEATMALPDWANWRDEAFGFTFEPAVIAYNRELVPEGEVPRSRDALLRLLREGAERYRGRVVTYDIGGSGIGYLLATQDSVLFASFWQLVGALGHVDARVVCCTAEMLDLLGRGEALIAYNALGSYAQAQAASGAPVGIAFPDDYTLVVTRVAVIPRASPHPILAGEFVDYLLSVRGQEVLASRSALPAIIPGANAGASAARLREQASGQLQPIALEPSLLVFLDPLKRERFLRQWRLAFEVP